MTTTYSKIVYFKNWTNKDFTYKYDNQDQTFEAGQMYSLPAEIAEHFAHHLAVRECFERKLEFLPADKMKEFMDKCFPGGSVDSLQRQGLPIDKIDIKDSNATPSPSIMENKTDSDFQQEVTGPEPDVRDNKVLKKLGRPKKTAKTTDEQYVK